MDWAIKPFIGIGDLRFGMTPGQVADVLGGTVKFTRPIEDGSTNEIREGGKLPVCNYLEDKLRCIDIYALNYDTSIDGFLVFQNNPQLIVNHLEHIGGPPSVVYGICYFKSIGVSLGKWINPHNLVVKERPSRNEDLRSVSISIRGAHFDIFTDEKLVSLYRKL